MTYGSAYGNITTVSQRIQKAVARLHLYITKHVLTKMTLGREKNI